MSLTDNILVAVLLLLLGAGGGIWLSNSNYRPQLDTANRSLATVTGERDSCVALTTEQGQQLGELRRQGDAREQAAKQAQEEASTKAQPYESNAIRVLTERIGGDECAAATTVIDLELGL